MIKQISHHNDQAHQIKINIRESSSFINQHQKLISLLEQQVTQLSQAILILEDQIILYEKGVKTILEKLELKDSQTNYIGQLSIICEEIQKIVKDKAHKMESDKNPVIVVKEIEVPVYITKEVEKIVYVTQEVEVEKIVISEIEKPVFITNSIEVEKPIYITKEVEVEKPIFVEMIVEKPIYIERTIERECLNCKKSE